MAHEMLHMTIECCRGGGQPFPAHTVVAAAATEVVPEAALAEACVEQLSGHPYLVHRPLSPQPP